MAQISNRDLMHLYQEIAEHNHGNVKTDQYAALLKGWQVDQKSLIKQMDANKSGNINPTEISNALKISVQDRTEDDIPRGVEIVTSDMKKYRLLNLIKIVKLNMAEHNNPEMMLRQIKVDLDRIYGRAHHCFLIKGKYCGYYSHETGTSIVFKTDDEIFVIYKSPDV